MAKNPLSNEDQALLTCRAQHCNNLGDCVLMNGLQVCDCMLGYRGDACEGTVNDGISAPLTLGILGFLIGFIALAFILAFFQQKRTERLWKEINQRRDSMRKNAVLSFKNSGRRNSSYV